jgi:hypothetical protein
MSFGWCVLFRQGSWLEFRDFALTQRKNVSSRLFVIQSELSKIGNVVAQYERADVDNPKSPMTEKRVGIAVTPNSSIGKLMRVYTARGGNPFDISMFLIPDSYEIIDNERVPTQPYFGVLAPQSGDADSDRIDQTGVLNTWKEPTRKLGDKNSIWDDESTQFVGLRMRAARSWIKQEIKELRNDIEARILKLCDLREQLLKERNEIIYSAVGASLSSYEVTETDFVKEYDLVNIVYLFDTTFFELNESGQIDFSKPKPYTSKEFASLVEDAPTGEEKYTAL